MKNLKAKIIFAALLIAPVGAILPQRPAAEARSTGSVRSQVTNAPVGYYHAWLFKTGDPYPTQKSAQFYVGAYQNPTIQFNNVTTGSRYFVRVVDDTCSAGGQSNDGYLGSGTLNLPQCQVTRGWTAGCPE